MSPCHTAAAASAVVLAPSHGAAAAKAQLLTFPRRRVPAVPRSNPSMLGALRMLHGSPTADGNILVAASVYYILSQLKVPKLPLSVACGYAFV